jgi:hypothetical protein
MYDFGRPLSCQLENPNYLGEFMSRSSDSNSISHISYDTFTIREMCLITSSEDMSDDAEINQVVIVEENKSTLTKETPSNK